jgi:hypothetical protein
VGDEIVRIVIVCLLILLFIGCTSYVQKIVAPEPPSTTQVAALLTFFDQAKSLQPQALDALYTAEEAAFLYQDSAENTIRLAMLLTIRNTTFRDPNRATLLLQKYMASNPQNAELRQLASLLLYMTANLRQYEAVYKDTKKKLNANVVARRTQERQYHSVRNQLKEVQSEKQEQQAQTRKVDTELRKERQAVEDLRKKIEQLKTIEKTITDRKKELQPST